MQHGHALAAELNPGHLSDVGSGHADALLSYIVCSDLVYFPELFGPLLRTLLQLSSPPFSTAAQPVKVVISYMIRSLEKESPFWSAFGAWFNFSPVLVRHGSDKSTPWERFGSHGDGRMFIFVATRRPETLALIIPDDDRVLRMRGDDGTFDTMLLMNLPNND